MTKTINTLFYLAIFCLFVGCVKMEENSSDSEKIIDTWTVDFYEATIDIETLSQGGSLISSISEVQLLETEYEITFSDIDFTTEGNYNVSITSTLDGDSQTNLYPLESISEKGNYELTEGENLLMTEGSLFNLDVHIDLGIEVRYLKEEQNMTYEFADNGNLTLTQNQTFVIEDGSFTTTYKLTVRTILVNY